MDYTLLLRKEPSQVVRDLKDHPECINSFLAFAESLFSPGSKDKQLLPKILLQLLSTPFADAIRSRLAMPVSKEVNHPDLHASRQYLEQLQILFFQLGQKVQFFDEDYSLSENSSLLGPTLDSLKLKELDSLKLQVLSLLQGSSHSGRQKALILLSQMQDHLSNLDSGNQVQISNWVSSTYKHIKQLQQLSSKPPELGLKLVPQIQPLRKQPIPSLRPVVKTAGLAINNPAPASLPYKAAVVEQSESSMIQPISFRDSQSEHSFSVQKEIANYLGGRGLPRVQQEDYKSVKTVNSPVNQLRYEQPRPSVGTLPPQAPRSNSKRKSIFDARKNSTQRQLPDGRKVVDLQNSRTRRPIFDNANSNILKVSHASYTQRSQSCQSARSSGEYPYRGSQQLVVPFTPRPSLQQSNQELTSKQKKKKLSQLRPKSETTVLPVMRQRGGFRLMQMEEDQLWRLRRCCLRRKSCLYRNNFMEIGLVTKRNKLNNWRVVLQLHFTASIAGSLQVQIRPTVWHRVSCDTSRLKFPANTRCKIAVVVQLLDYKCDSLPTLDLLLQSPDLQSALRLPVSLPCPVFKFMHWASKQQLNEVRLSQQFLEAAEEVTAKLQLDSKRINRGIFQHLLEEGIQLDSSLLLAGWLGSSAELVFLRLVYESEGGARAEGRWGRGEAGLGGQLMRELDRLLAGSNE